MYIDYVLVMCFCCSMFSLYNDIIFSLFLIFFGAAVFATFALYTRQSLLVAYIMLGVLMGPWGLNLVSNPVLLKDVGDIGIIFLLFLLGLNLQPQNLLKLLRETTVITVVSSTLFGLVGYAASKFWGFSHVDALIIGACMMFSSTIIGLKLLPTTVLHHQRTGEIVISILLLQDILAIFVLLILHDANDNNGVFNWLQWIRVIVSLPLLFLIAFVAERFLLMKLIRQFSRIHEYLFLVALGWCMGIGQLGEMMDLSFEIGAFIAGISIAQSPISRFIADSLRPIRDFFLILFFFSIGARINLSLLNDVWILALFLGGLMLIIKPIVLAPLLRKIAPTNNSAWEIGIRIGQISEFSLLVAYAAEKSHVLSQNAYVLIQLSTIFSFIVSSYWVVNVYPNPIAMSEKLRRD